MQEELRVELPLLPVERSQSRWFGHLGRTPPGRLPGELFWARPSSRVMSLIPPRGVGGSGWGKECLDLSVQTVAPVTWTWISSRK